MTSFDNVGFMREDVFAARMDALGATIEKNFVVLHADIEKQLMQVNSQMDKKDAKNEQNFSEVRNEIRVLNTRMDGLDARLTDLQSSISWGFTVIAVLVAIFTIIISVLVAFAPTIWAIRKKPRKSTVQRNDVRNIVSQQITEALNNYFGGKVQ